MMKIVFLFVAVFFQETSANFLCFCNFLHPYGSYLYECPSRSSQLIGIIYPPENTDHYVDLSSPHCVAAFNAQAPQGWVAIYYNSNNVNKLGYMFKDSGFLDRQCPGTLSFNVQNVVKSDKCTHHIGPIPGLVLPTATVPTTAPTQRPTAWVTLPTAHPQVNQQNICDGRRLEIGIVQHLTVFNADSRHCPNSAVADEEGVVMAYCKAPEVKQWKRHTNVMSDCKSIPKYSPISFFFGDSVLAGTKSGIFIECTSSSFVMARQLCSNMFLEKVTIPPFLASHYHVLQW
ncbi:uncharacterized protein LOC128189044 [Crassostrea angulata]|uniref:uncharacterized protein LOC128189044 n=1 Tax=Magallana angulata TaxID=2784310 RepID=UPI0022B1D699|nr:uncharacterized protein LOC128189044 [Crassostrea angulata]